MLRIIFNVALRFITYLDVCTVLTIFIRVPYTTLKKKLIGCFGIYENLGRLKIQHPPSPYLISSNSKGGKETLLLNLSYLILGLSSFLYFGLFYSLFNLSLSPSLLSLCVILNDLSIMQEPMKLIE